MIVASVKSFGEYQQQHAWTWEHQALVRARVLCGGMCRGALNRSAAPTCLKPPARAAIALREVRDAAKSGG